MSHRLKRRPVGVRRTGKACGAGRVYPNSPAPFTHWRLGLVREPEAYLYHARLLVSPDAREPEVERVYQVAAGEVEAVAVEDVEGFSADFKSHRLRQPRLLEQADVLAQERQDARAADGRRRVAEKDVRVRVVGGIRRVDRAGRGELGGGAGVARG